MNRVNVAISTLLMAAFTSSAAAQSADIAEQVKACAGVKDQAARLACFDTLGERVLREEPAGRGPKPEKTARPEAEAAASASLEPLPDDLGMSKNVQYVGWITSCRKGASDDWFFFFDNGQVWKEVNGRSRRFKECNFEATITMDGFGYKMRIDGSDRTIRVKRHR